MRKAALYLVIAAVGVLAPAVSAQAAQCPVALAIDDFSADAPTVFSPSPGFASHPAPVLGGERDIFFQNPATGYASVGAGVLTMEVAPDQSADVFVTYDGLDGSPGVGSFAPPLDVLATGATSVVFTVGPLTQPAVIFVYLYSSAVSYSYAPVFLSPSPVSATYVVPFSAFSASSGGANLAALAAVGFSGVLGYGGSTVIRVGSFHFSSATGPGCADYYPARAARISGLRGTLRVAPRVLRGHADDARSVRLTLRRHTRRGVVTRRFSAKVSDGMWRRALRRPLAKGRYTLIAIVKGELGDTARDVARFRVR